MRFLAKDKAIRDWFMFFFSPTALWHLTAYLCQRDGPISACLHFRYIIKNKHKRVSFISVHVGLLIWIRNREKFPRFLLIMLTERREEEENVSRHVMMVLERCLFDYSHFIRREESFFILDFKLSDILMKTTWKRDCAASSWRRPQTNFLTMKARDLSSCIRAL